ncbi:MAG: NfeD family protein [Frankia sp.]|nr:NfeD family protein [Frankia sp.]
MSAAYIWLIVAGALAAGELLVGDFSLLMFALAALVGAGAAGLDLGPVWQVTAFVLAAVGFTLGLRPVARRHLTRSPPLLTGTDALIGAEGVVVEPVDGQDGRVKIKGEIWSARAFPEGSAIPVGTAVRVLRIEGATAVVHEQPVPGKELLP